MKLLLIDDVKRCRDCPAYNGITCQSTNQQIGFARATLHVDTNCPLIELPSKRKSSVEWLNGFKTHDLTEFDKGWNECVDYLTRK